MAIRASADSGSPPRTDEAGLCFSAPGRRAWSCDALCPRKRERRCAHCSQFPSLRVSWGLRRLCP